MDKRHVIQNNGQKTLLPTVKQEPKRGSELYVALPKACLEGFLYAIFSQVISLFYLLYFNDFRLQYLFILVWYCTSNPIDDAFLWF